MADSNALELLQLGNKLFAGKSQLDSLWQTLAEAVYPEKADFTTTRIDGDTFADGLYTSLPAQNRRSLAEAIGALTRRKDRPWFMLKIKGMADAEQDVKDWLSWAQDEQRGYLYAGKAMFQDAMQVGDDDFVTFGNSVTMLAEDDERTGLMVFMDCHLRDCAWSHDRYRRVNVMHRKFKESLRNIAAKPGWGMKALSSSQQKILEKDPYHEIELRHCVMPNEDYDSYLTAKKGKKKHPYCSVYINSEAQTIIQEGGYIEFPYHVRRWKLNNQSAYGYSPAAMLGLVESRLLQSQERVIMDAGERVVDPPSIATKDAVLGQVANYAGATTWIAADYDERTGPALQYVDTKANIPVGLEMKQDTRQILAACWYINKLTLPAEGDMTAFEVNERIDEYIRTIGPAVEPFEAHNALLLDTHFSFLMRVGMLGPIESIPQALQGADTTYEFDGPVQLAYRRQKLMKAREFKVYAFDPNVLAVRPETLDIYDFDKIDRDAAEYMGAEPGWMKPEEAVAATRQQRAAAMEAEQQKQEGLQMGEALKGAIETVPAATEAVQQMPQLAKGLEGMGLGA